MKPGKGQRLDVGGGVTVEYARRQGLVRVHGPSARVELPLREFLTQLGVQPADACPTRHYMLFGGADDHPSGGMGDLIDVYTDEQEAREAFQRLRLATGSGPGWAQLVALTPNGSVERLCWFSPEAGVNAIPTKESEATKRRWRARRKQVQPMPPAPPPPPRAPQRTSTEAPPDETRPVLAAFSSPPNEAPRTYGFPGRPAGPTPPRGSRRRR